MYNWHLLCITFLTLQKTIIDIFISFLFSETKTSQNNDQENYILQSSLCDSTRDANSYAVYCLEQALCHEIVSLQAFGTVLKTILAHTILKWVHTQKKKGYEAKTLLY